MDMNMRTPLAKVHGLGSAREGSDHFWWQRVTAGVTLVFSLVVVIVLVALVGKDHATVHAAIASPFVSVPLLVFIVAGVSHMRLGMQVIIEDYVHAMGLKMIGLLANNFFAIFIVLACVFAVLKVAIGT